MRAMIFAAGLGTRLKPITDTLPKALVPVCGRPLLDHVISKMKDNGIDDVVINVHHFSEKIKEYVKENGSFDISVKISDESEALLETGGGVQHAKDLLLDTEDKSGKFLVHNVDIVSNLDFKWFESMSDKDDLSTILVSERKTQRYFLFDESMRLVGWTNIATGEVRSPYPDLDVNACRKLAFAGIHIMSDKIFDAFEALGFSGKFPIVDFYLKACKDYPIHGVVAENLTLVDVGKIDTLAEAEKVVSEIESK